MRSANTLAIRSLYTADSVGGNPATSNVRSGTVYGPNSELTGTCAVPPAASVGVGVPVDNTTGTAAIDGPSIRAALGMASANLDTQLDALPTAAEAATAVRSELTTELGRVDATISSRLATSGYTTPPTVGDIATAVWAAATRTLTTAIDNSATIAAAVWAYASGRTITGGTITDLTNAPDVPSADTIASRVWATADKAGYSLTEAERTAISTAVQAGILNESDGQAILSAIVGAIGNTSVDQVALVAAIRADLERTGGTLATRLAASAYSAAPSAQTVATEVWNTTARTITGGTVDNVANATPIDAGEIAEAVRTELQPELARLSNAVTTQEVGDIVEGAMQP